MAVTKLIKTTGLIAGSLLALTLALPSSHAADHQEAPGATSQLAADLGDYYVWHADGQLNVIITFGTFAAPELPATFNSNILYGLHFDTSETPDGVSDIDMFAQFAQNAAGDWGIRVTTADGSTIEGPVETILTSDDTSVWTGLADDPFFFNQSGFNDTVATGTLSFDPEQDDVAGLNITAIAIQMPVDAIVGQNTAFQTWSTTASL